eukprot:CAMPEP_0184657448 /NCGR_PEP_ID=MMETSP0308-20130426/19637_1 /TAXON_ID=38269 /ORGANISM="Gloeochaete witrockiana, Strain SAG 46.84" /LENGTH=224 /DNA_ID=CAMNT_0027095285 /DNA_START=242 /DNA_END=916 /DNA_ORIENTATION=+
MSGVNLGAQGASQLLPDMSKEVKLWNDQKERERIEQISDLYSIIKTVEHLEKAYVRDAIPASEYAPACQKLIAQFKTLQQVLRDSVPDVERFMADYRMECKAAANRLLRAGVPATIEHGGPISSSDGAQKAVAETTQYFITALDNLRLNQTAVDQVFPRLTDLMEGLNRLTTLPPTYEGKNKVKAWVEVLNKMKASDQLSEDQVRQLCFDLESAYDAFHRALSK